MLLTTVLLSQMHVLLSALEAFHWRVLMKFIDLYTM